MREILVVANRTLGGAKLLDAVRSYAASGDVRFRLVVPQQGRGGSAPREARARLATMLDRLQAAGLVASGMIGDPDPYTATLNALELFTVDDVVISTLPGERSGWQRADLIERVRHATSADVEHVVVDLKSTPTAAPAA
jgi:hypothetical protein